MQQVRSAPADLLPSAPSSHLFAQAMSFAALNLDARLLAHLTTAKDEGGMGLTAPTDIQSRVIPLAMKSNDVLVKSETGSGKTLAFVLPILHGLVTSGDRMSRSDGLFALVLSPTRELCVQIFSVLVAASKPFPWIVSSAVIGGEKKKSEKARLRKGVNILVATPGRLADHIRTTESLSSALRALRTLVLDEADRLMDAGFEKQVEEILGALATIVPQGFQTMLLSATMTSGVEKLAGRALRNPVAVEGASNVRAGTGGTEVVSYTVPRQLVQHYLVVESADRLVMLVAFVRRHVRRTGNACKLLLFVASRACADFVYALLSRLRWPEADEPGLGTKWWVLHGSVEQAQRAAALRDFARARGGVLVCTDVAARGIDLPDIDVVVQMDAPSEVSEYVHRVGRTARTGRAGSAVIFLREAELGYLALLSTHGVSMTPVKADAVYESLVPQGKAGWDAAKEQLRAAMERMVASDQDGLARLAAQAFASYVGAYAVHSTESKHIFVPRALHLGHVAKSFALKTPPSKVASAPGKRQAADGAAQPPKKRNKPMDRTLEFAA